MDHSETRQPVNFSFLFTLTSELAGLLIGNGRAGEIVRMCSVWFGPPY